MKTYCLYCHLADQMRNRPYVYIGLKLTKIQGRKLREKQKTKNAMQNALKIYICKQIFVLKKKILLNSIAFYEKVWSNNTVVKSSTKCAYQDAYSQLVIFQLMSGPNKLECLSWQAFQG